MIALIQRVSEASVTIEHKIKGCIKQGLLLFIGISHDDTNEDCEWLAKKIIGLRIFEDENGKMNLDIKAIDGNILLISQFTLHASTKKGNRPSFIAAAKPTIAQSLYQEIIKKIELELSKEIATGEFGANMQVALINDGPVTLIIDSKNKI